MVILSGLPFNQIKEVKDNYFFYRISNKIDDYFQRVVSSNEEKTKN
jgi:hypothetical protein